VKLQVIVRASPDADIVAVGETSVIYASTPFVDKIDELNAAFPTVAGSESEPFAVNTGVAVHVAPD
jgi:hypothetical protein